MVRSQRESVVAAGLLATVILGGLGVGEEEWEWEEVLVGGREYVTAESVRGFYEFGETEREEGGVVFRKEGLEMRWRGESAVMEINGVKFGLSWPVKEGAGGWLVSRVDLVKLLDPVLRPWVIEGAELFDTVVIDAGHGGADSGALGPHGAEKDFTLDLALKVREEVEKLGFRTRLTREEDRAVSLLERVLMGNAVEKSVFVSLHFNHGQSGEAGGVETFALAPPGVASDDGTLTGKRFQGNRRDAENIALATAVHAMLLAGTGAVDRGVKRARYDVLRGMERPGILVESGFLTQAEEGRKIADEGYRRVLARSMAEGIRNYRRALGKDEG